MTEALSPRYELTWEPEAIDRLALLVKEYPDVAKAVIPAIYELAANPLPVGSSALGGAGLRRLLLGYYRVLYQVVPDPPIVRIVLVGRTDKPR